jgi:hypothetical protein
MGRLREIGMGILTPIDRHMTFIARQNLCYPSNSDIFCHQMKNTNNQYRIEVFF